MSSSAQRFCLEPNGCCAASTALPAVRIAKSLAGFPGLPHVTLEDAALAAKALDWTLKGMDFADALHLAMARECDGFVELRSAGCLRAAKGLSGVGSADAVSDQPPSQPRALPKLPRGIRTIRPVRL